MKKYYLLLLFVTSFVGAQIVNIPDANFKAKLLSASTLNGVARDINYNSIKLDINDDNEIQVSEALLAFSLNVSNSNVVQMIGIESFQNLTQLECYVNPLGSLDVSALINLEFLSAGFSQLYFINLSGLVYLKGLNLGFSQLTTLDLSNLVNLEYVICSNNLLTNINLTGVPNLNQLTCNDNFITYLDFSTASGIAGITAQNNLLTSLSLINLNELVEINVSTNQLTFLHIENCPQLSHVYFADNLLTNVSMLATPEINTLNFSDNPLTNVDFVSSFPNLEYLYCSNTLISSLDLSNNSSFTYLTCKDNPNLLSLFLKFGRPNLIVDYYPIENNPNLQYVCLDDFRIASFSEYFVLQNLNNIVVNSYCSFTPGGNYNTITGSMLFDSNSNGCDASDPPHPNIRIDINDGINQGATFTNPSGNYTFFTQIGSFNITPDVENPSWFNFSSTTVTIPFANNNDNIVTQNFCITANGIHPDLEIVIVPVIPARPGFDAVYKIVYKNKGNQTVNGVVNFTYNDAVLDFISSSVIPSNSGSGLMNWTISNIAPFQVGNFVVTFNVNSPQEIPAVNIDDVLSFNATITTPSDDNLADNSFDFDQIVVGSYDPNDITCLEGNSLPLIDIGAYLHYNIRFENTGTAAAENIVVASAINLSQYNIQSLQVMESSHPMEVKITGNMAEFIFQNINLDAGGHGNILLKMKSNNALSNNFVMNSADIFFDYNFPIETNDEQTVFADLSKNDFNKELNLQIYPNPTDNIITIKSDATINTIQLYDAQGRILQTIMTTEVLQTVDLSAYATGIYYVSIATDNGKQTQKVIKK